MRLAPLALLPLLTACPSAPARYVEAEIVAIPSASAAKSEPPAALATSPSAKSQAAPSQREGQDDDDDDDGAQLGFGPPLPTPAPPPTVTGGGPFDRAAAAAALAAANPAACAMRGGQRGPGHVTITFVPSGVVLRAVVDSSPFAGTPTGSCIEALFRNVRVPPFSGSPVTVGKSFSVP